MSFIFINCLDFVLVLLWFLLWYLNFFSLFLILCILYSNKMCHIRVWVCSCLCKRVPFFFFFFFYLLVIGHSFSLSHVVQIKGCELAALPATRPNYHNLKFSEHSIGFCHNFCVLNDWKLGTPPCLIIFFEKKLRNNIFWNKDLLCNLCYDRVLKQFCFKLKSWTNNKANVFVISILCIKNYALVTFLFPSFKLWLLGLHIHHRPLTVAK